jgi:hypothetical protein
MRIPALLVLICVFAAPVQAEQYLRSQPAQATVLELYTSEGCSSCPPADRWFSGLVDHPDLWQHLVPVTFHVDYWNYLGWEDRFADSGHGQCQRDYKRQGSTNGVTPRGLLQRAVSGAPGGRIQRAYPWPPKILGCSNCEKLCRVKGDVRIAEGRHPIVPIRQQLIHLRIVLVQPFHCLTELLIAQCCACLQRYASAIMVPLPNKPSTGARC